MKSRGPGGEAPQPTVASDLSEADDGAISHTEVRVLPCSSGSRTPSKLPTALLIQPVPFLQPSASAGSLFRRLQTACSAYKRRRARS